MIARDEAIGEQAASPARSAALLLHALCESDRDWLLQQLRPEDSGALRGMLAELGQMGIPADCALVDGALGGVSCLKASDTGTHHDATQVHRPALPGTSDADVIADLRQATPVILADVLRSESPWVIAIFLLAADWSWREQVLAHLGAPARGRVESAMRDQQRDSARIRAASALRASLCRQVHKCLDARTQHGRAALAQNNGQQPSLGEASGQRDRASAHRRSSWPAWLSRLGFRR